MAKIPKYPILLAHGAGGDLALGMIRCTLRPSSAFALLLTFLADFKGVKEYLESLGVYVGQYDGNLSFYSYFS